MRFSPCNSILRKWKWRRFEPGCRLLRTRRWRNRRTATARVSRPGPRLAMEAGTEMRAPRESGLAIAPPGRIQNGIGIFEGVSGEESNRAGLGVHAAIGDQAPDAGQGGGGGGFAADSVAAEHLFSGHDLGVVHVHDDAAGEAERADGFLPASRI